MKRTFFYDDCDDADRLAAEYVQTTPANWVQISQAPYQTYRQTSSGASEFCTLMSIPDMKDYEVNHLMKATNADAMMGVVLRKGRTNGWDTGVPYLWCTGGNFMLAFRDKDGATPVLNIVAYAVDTTKWHHLRARIEGRRVLASIWPNDEPEPDWMIDHYIHYHELRWNGSIALMGTVRTVYHSNLHLTPFIRYGGRATVTP